METESPRRTEEVGEAWGRVLREGDVLLLVGELGAGKTTLVRGLARGNGVDQGVKSPTFVLHLPYPGRILLNHLDLYRIPDPSHLAELGLDEVFDEGAAVVEWGERLGEETPEGVVWIRFRETGPERRRLVVEGPLEPLTRFARAVGVEPK